MGHCCVRDGFITDGAVRTTVDCVARVVSEVSKTTACRSGSSRELKLLPASLGHITANKISQPGSRLDLEKSKEVSLPFVSHCFV